MQTFGYAALQVIPSLKGASKVMESELNTAASKAGGVKAGSTLGTKITSGLKTAVKVGAVGVGAILGYSITKGFQRLSAIEDAQASMRGLGMTAGEVSTYMDKALNSVKGTAFGLDEAAGIAAVLATSGVKGGAEMERSLRNVADAATVGRTTMTDMGGIFAKVAAKGKVDGEIINQLTQRQIGILPMLAEHYGVTTAEASKMVSQGKVDFETFSSVMEKNLGGAALESGNTTRGAFANMQAAIGRFGVAIIGGVFPHLKGAMTSIGDLFDNAAEAIEPFATAVGQWLGKAIENLVKWVSQLDFSNLTDLSSGADWSGMGSSLASIGDSFKTMGPALGEIAAASPGVLATALQVLATALGFVAQHADKLGMVLPVLVGGFLLWKGATAAATSGMTALRLAELAATPVTLANNIMRRQSIRLEMQLAAAKGVNTTATNIATLSTARGTVALVARKVAMVAQLAVTKAIRVATLAWAGVQWVLNAALSANPIGLVVIAITALVGAIVWAWNNSEGFKNAIIAGWTWIQNAGTAIWEAIKVAVGVAWQGIVWWFENLNPVGIIFSHWDQIKAGAEAAWEWITSTVKGLWTGFVDWITGSVDGLSTSFVGGVTGLRDRAIAAWNHLKAMTVQAVVGMVTSAVGKVNELRAQFTAKVNQLRATALNIWAQLKARSVQAVVGMVTSVVGKANQLRAQFTARVNQLRASVQAAFARVRTAMTQPVSSAVSTLSGIPGRIRSIFTGAGSWLVNSGRSIIDGFVRGIRNSIGRVKDAASSVVKAARDFFPFSPAKVGPFSGRGWVEYSGQSIGEGFAHGLHGSTSVVERAANAVAEAATISVAGPTIGHPQIAGTAAAVDVQPPAVRGPYMRSMQRHGDLVDGGEERVVEVKQYISTQDPEAAAQRSTRLIMAGLA